MAGTRYPQLRRLLGPQHRGQPDATVERAVAQQGLEAGAVEDFLSDLGNIAAAALPVVGGVVGSIIPGVGTAIGTGVGALAGGALHAAINSGQSSPAPAPAPAPPAMPAAPTVLQAGLPSAYGPSPYPLPGAFGLPASSGMPASSQQAVALLLQVLMRPELMNSLLSMLLGTAGTPTVPVGNSPVPVTAFTNLLSNLAGQVSEAYNAERGSSAYAESTHYTARAPWGTRADLSSQESRSAALLQLLQESGDGGIGRTRRRQRLANLAQALRMVQSEG